MSLKTIYSNFINYLSTKSQLIINFLENLPELTKNLIIETKVFFKDFRYRLANLTETNYNLGLKYLHNGNLNDAVLRFKIIINFFDKNHHASYNSLGWCYFLKNDNQKALKYLQQSGEPDQTDLLKLLSSKSDISEISPQLAMEIKKLRYGDPKFIAEVEKLYYEFYQFLIEHIQELPAQPDFLELPVNHGWLGSRLKEYFSEQIIITGVEESSQITQEILNRFLPEIVYDKMINANMENFFTGQNQKNDVIILNGSFCISKNLEVFINKLLLILNKGGYLALLVLTAEVNKFDMKNKQFAFNLQDLKNMSFSEFEWENSEIIFYQQEAKYCMIIGRKT